MKRVLVFAGIIAALLIGAVLALKVVLSPAYFAEQLQTRITQSTGRTLSMSAQPELSYWPDLSIELRGVVLSNPPDMYANGQVVSMDVMRVRIAAAPLLRRKVEVKELTLVRPRLNLLVDGQGRSNWTFEQSSGAGKSDSNSAANRPLDTLDMDLSIAPIVMEDGEVRFLDERSGATFAASHANVTMTVTSLTSPVEIKGSLVWNKQPLTLAAFVKAPQRLAADGSPVDLNVSSPFLQVAFSGQGKLAGGLALAGKLEASSPSVRQLSSWAGFAIAPGNGLGPLSVKAALDLSGETINLKDAVLGLDDMKAQGNAELSIAGPRPRLTASLGVNQINIDTYAPPSSGSTGSGASGNGDWSDAAIDFSGLGAADANLELAVGEIRYRNVTIGRSTVSAILRDRRLNAKLKEMAFYGGKATGQIVVNGAVKKPTLQGALNAQGLDGFKLLKDFAGIERIEGRANITVSLAGAGNSQREMVSRLRGTGRFRFSNGAIRGINIARMIRNVDKAILTGWDGGQHQSTDFSQLEANFKIEDAIAENRDLTLIGPLVRVTGAGTVDILKREIDYKVVPKLVASLQGQGGDAGLTGLPVPVIVKGPWSNPRVYPDIAGILSNPQAAFDALSKLTGQGGKIDVNALSKKATEALDGKIGDKAKQLLGQDAGKTLGGSSGQSVESTGKDLLKNLLGTGQQQ